jgi:putative methionine-R-sulfoxide reductase with GAF domain
VSDDRGALEAVDRIVDRGGEADDVLRAVVEALHDRLEHYSWVGVYLVEGEELELGPSNGSRNAELPQMMAPISFEERVVGRLAVEIAETAAFSESDRELLERVALLISPYCLVAWDTGGEHWSP